MKIKEIILPYVLQNAVFYNGKANVKSSLSKILGENQELRKQAKEVMNEVGSLVKEVNKLSLGEQKKKLGELDPKMLVKEEKSQERILPELPEAKKVVMRMAPNPNGPLHIGHCRMAVLNDEYVKKYGGSLLLRFDDTDPKNDNKLPMKEAYVWIEEDLKWLGVKYNDVQRASSRLDVYYSYFHQLLEKGFAYVCTCEQEKWSELVRMKRKSCPCREIGLQEQLHRWTHIVAHKYKEGEAVGRVRTDLKKEKNPAVLDWVAFRIIDKPQHPFSNSHLWPTLDFASAIDDKEFGTTHIIRGKDLASSEEKQKILYGFLGWKYPVTRVYGKFMTSDDMVVSKRKVLDGIKQGKYTGYDDPKLVFLRALKRRGIQPQAIRNYILNLGLSEAETTVDLKILHAENKKIIDPIANRYMVVLDPVKIEINHKTKKVEAIRHPENPNAGKKEIPVSNNIFIEKSDFENNKGKTVRLKELFNVSLGKTLKYEGDSVEKAMQKIQWVSEPNTKVKVIFPDKVIEGMGEPEVSKLKVGEIIQMERVGFGIVESQSKGLTTIVFSHK